jgi:DNA-binding transcriptional ArsR family regulator
MPRRNGTGIALLADETRRRIVAIVADRPRRPSEIARELGLSRPATSRQLRILREAGLLRGMRYPIDRRGIVYRLNPVAQLPIIAWLAATDVPIAARHSAKRRPASWAIRPAGADEDDAA